MENIRLQLKTLGDDMTAYINATRITFRVSRVHKSVERVGNT